MELQILTASALLLSATTLSANSITGNVEFGTMFDTSEDLSITTLHGTVDGTYDFGASAFGLRFGADHASVDIDENGSSEGFIDHTELFAALSFDTSYGTFLVGKPRTATDSVLTRATTYAPIYDAALAFAFVGQEASKTLIALDDDAKPYGAGFETDAIEDTKIGLSIHRFGDAYPDLYVYSVAATRSFGAVDFGLGFESMNNNGDAINTFISTVAYNGNGFSVGLDVNEVNATEGEGEYSTYILSGDWSVSDAVTIGSSYTNYSAGDVKIDLLALNAEYAFANGVALNAGLVQQHYEENFSSSDTTYVAFSVGYSF